MLQPTEHLKPHFITTPHITIARQMLDIQSKKAWEEWKNQDFNTSFHADEMILLKRDVGGGKYEKVATFRFGGNGFSDEQLLLNF